MKILFAPMGTVPFHGKSLEERPLGGTETAVICLAKALKQLGHKVFVLSDHANPPLTDPVFIPFSALELVGAVDALIGVRDWRSLALPVKSHARAFWTGDSYDQPVSIGLGDFRVMKLIDLFFAVSEWHRDTMCSASGFPVERVVVIRNGIQPELFSGSEERLLHRLIYSSTPYRGLEHLHGIFPAIRERFPDAQLHLFSGHAVYSGEERDPRMEAEFNRYIQPFSSISGCHIHGNVTQGQLAREYMKSSVLAYPNTFEETSCITAMEAQVAGCVPVTSFKGALPETIGNAGVLIKGDPNTEEYKRLFIDAVCDLFANRERWSALSDLGKSKIAYFSWDRVAERVTAALSYLVSQKKSLESHSISNQLF